jgi:hypothetical protein
MAATMKAAVKWDVIPCSLVEITNISENHIASTFIPEDWKHKQMIAV